MATRLGRVPFQRSPVQNRYASWVLLDGVEKKVLRQWLWVAIALATSDNFSKLGIQKYSSM
ncbi:hypothetical protein D3C80_825630 [compost metagenome]